MRIDNVPAALLDEAVREQLFGRHKPYGMPIVGLCRRREEAQRQRSHGFLSPSFYAPNNAVLIVAGDTTADAGAQARREALRADPEPQGRAAAAPGGGRHRPAAARDARRCARRRAALVARFPGAVLPQGRNQARLCAAGAGAPVRRRRDQPPVARPGGRPQDRAVGWAGYSPSQLGLTSFGSRRPSRVAAAAIAEIESAVGDQMKQAARRRRHGRGSRAGAEPAAGERDLLAGFAGERPAPLRHARSASAAPSPTSTPGRRRIAAVTAGRRRCRRPPCLARRRARSPRC